MCNSPANLRSLIQFLAPRLLWIAAVTPVTPVPRPLRCGRKRNERIGCGGACGDWCEALLAWRTLTILCSWARLGTTGLSIRPICPAPFVCGASLSSCDAIGALQPLDISTKGDTVVLQEKVIGFIIIWCVGDGRHNWRAGVLPKIPSAGWGIALTSSGWF